VFQSIIDFWFHEISASQHWKVDPIFDALMRERFSAIHTQANRGELYSWRREPRGRLAEVIVLDQFSRNMFRGSPAAFSSDAIALVLAQEAVAVGADQALPPDERIFLYMPYMHSESPLIHEAALALFKANGTESNLEFERRHKEIIDRFGRYPHRNAILGRESTPEEIEFLKLPGSRF
jgi:uncharacterized protein (DUF924 family)